MSALDAQLAAGFFVGLSGFEAVASPQDEEAVMIIANLENALQWLAEVGQKTLGDNARGRASGTSIRPDFSRITMQRASELRKTSGGRSRAAKLGRELQEDWLADIDKARSRREDVERVRRGEKAQTSQGRKAQAAQRARRAGRAWKIIRRLPGVPG